MVTCSVSRVSRTISGKEKGTSSVRSATHRDYQNGQFDAFIALLINQLVYKESMSRGTEDHIGAQTLSLIVWEEK